MGKLLSASIDVKKIKKDRLYAGAKGTYLKITISINDQIDQYGNNVSIWEEQTKEERDSKSDRNFLGNGKIVFDSSTGAGNSSALPKEDDLPF